MSQAFSLLTYRTNEKVPRSTDSELLFIYAEKNGTKIGGRDDLGWTYIKVQLQISGS